jgi:hypothetical protein
MDEKIREYIYSCPHCKGKMNDFFRGNFKGRYLNKKLNTFRFKHFCTEECYEDYKKDFVVEIYNNKPIYCVEINGEKRYMPYFEAEYYFTNIDDCKKRMDMKNTAVVDMSIYGFLNNMQK